MQIVVDLYNNTRYSDVHDFFGFAPWTVVYIHLQFWFTVPTSLIGNTIVVYTSLRYKSLNMDRISCALLENLAVTDLILVIVGGLPIYCTFCAKRWILGKVGCVLTFYITLIGGTCEIFTLAAISFYRAVLLKSPFFFRGTPTYKVRIGIVFLWIISTPVSLISLVSESTIYYEPTEMSCTSSVYSMAEAPLYVLTGLLFVLPMLIILISNIIMLTVSIRHKRRMSRMSSSVSEDDGNMRAVLTVTCVCWLFMISWLPWMIRILCGSWSISLPDWYFIFQAHVLTLNVVFNPIIYTFTCKSFKDVVKKRVFGSVISAVSRISRSSE
jgi:hypothetical protein